jgi:hypothetical protein
MSFIDLKIITDYKLQISLSREIAIVEIDGLASGYDVVIQYIVSSTKLYTKMF